MRWVRLAGVAAMIASAGLLITSGIVGGWRWTLSNLASRTLTAVLAPKHFGEWTFGSLKARWDFDPDHPRIFADRFAGQLIGLSDYSAPAPYSACGVSFWRVRETDPRGIVIIRAHIGPDGRFRCERFDLYAAESPVGLPEWADDIHCLRVDGTESHFAVEVDRLQESTPRGWMKHRNRTVVLLLERQVQQG